MKNAKHDRSIQAAVGALKSDEPTVELKSFSSAGTGLARVIVDVTHTAKSRTDASLVARAISRKLEGRFEAVAGSFVKIASGSFTDRLTGVVGKVREIVAVSEEAMKGFRAVASNMFMDEETDMWALKRTEAGDVLIRTSAEDDLSLLNLLEATASAGHRSSPEFATLSAMCSALADRVEGGDYVSYVDLGNRIVSGFVVATTDEGEALVLPEGAEEPDVIKLEAITESHETASFPEPVLTTEEAVDQEVALSSGNVDIPAMLAYYKRVYGHDPKFFAELSKRIKSHTYC